MLRIADQNSFFPGYRPRSSDFFDPHQLSFFGLNHRLVTVGFLPPQVGLTYCRSLYANFWQKGVPG